MAYDFKLLLDVLVGYRSDETRRAHRSLSVTAFVILTARLVGLKLTDVTAFGIQVTERSVLPVLGVASVLLLYWLTMFLIHWNRDREIEKERSSILVEVMDPLRKRHEAILAKDKDGKRSRPTDWPEVKAGVAAFNRQTDRTKKAANLHAIAQKAEIAVPIVLAVVAAVVLGDWFRQALD